MMSTEYAYKKNDKYGIAQSFDGLTPAQLDVAEMVAQGLSNREIASRRSCSLDTVKHHITSIYIRLGIHANPNYSKRAYVVGWVWHQQEQAEQS